MANEAEEIIDLNEEELDNIVGGAFNPDIVAQFDLKVLTNKRGAQGLFIRKEIAIHTSTSSSTSISQGPCSEAGLSKLVGNPDLKSISIMTNDKKWIRFSPDQLPSLLGN